MIKFKVNQCDGILKSLDVRFTKACDNNCDFCIEREGIDSLGVTDVKKMIKTTLNTDKKDILILGGEPLLFPELVLEYIKGIRDHADTIYLTTSLPRVITTDEGNKIFLEILHLLDGINISVHHYDDSKNNEVLNSSMPYDRLDFLRKMLKNEEFAEKARICCNLVRGFISTKYDIDKFVDTMYFFGAKHIKLNELQHVPASEFISFEDVYGVKFESPFAHGCQTDISYLFGNRLKITLKRSCFCNKDESIATATTADLIKCVQKCIKNKISPNKENTFQVLYENGELQNEWLKK